MSVEFPKAFGTSIFLRNNFGDAKMPDKLYKTIELEIKSCEPAVLKSYESFVKTAAGFLSINVEKIISGQKPAKKRYTLLKSAHVHRKHLVQYEIRTHYTWVHLNKLTGSTADTFLEYIERMLPEGVALKVTKVLLEPLPVHLTMEKINEAMKEIKSLK